MGILSIGASDKGTGKEERITITSEKGRLSDAEIERMVKEAEEYAESDADEKAKVEARNSLEGYLYNLKNSIADESQLKDKVSGEDRTALTEAVEEALTWMED